jgi:hypothetical protein
MIIVLSLAQPFRAVGGEVVFSADLDTKEGHYSTWRADGLQGTSGCSLIAEMTAAYRDKKWGSVLTFSVLGESDDVSVSLQLRRPKGADTLRAWLRSGTGTERRWTELEHTGALKKPFAVAIRWPAGTIEFRIDDRVVAAVPRTLPVNGVEFSASTADVHLRSISFDHAAE